MADAIEGPWMLLLTSLVIYDSSQLASLTIKSFDVRSVCFSGAVFPLTFIDIVFTVVERVEWSAVLNLK